MIQPPRRAVTRFFVPLIDVLLLLFCIFLLMPFVEKEATSGKLSPGESEMLRRQVAQLEAKIAELEKSREAPEDKQLIAELQEQLEKKTADRLVVRTFQVDPKTGTLSYLDTPPDGGRVRVEVRTEREANALIDRDVGGLVGTNQELLYLILYPRERSLYPTRVQEETYNRWFGRRVTLRWEDPEKTAGGKQS